MSNEEHPLWIKVEDIPPGYNDFAWVWSARLEYPELSLAHAYRNERPQFQTAWSAGDTEGLSVEYFSDVTHFMPLVTPKPPELDKTNGTSRS